MACQNTIRCTCTYTSCSHHRKCCECIDYHRRLGEAPGCLFSKEAERKYDRSLRNLFEDQKKNR
jgi:hypothetical protein